MGNRSSAVALRDTLMVLNNLRGDGCVDCRVMNADTAMDAVKALLQDEDSKVSKGRVEHLVTRLAEELLGKIVAYEDFRDDIDDYKKRVRDYDKLTHELESTDKSLSETQEKLRNAFLERGAALKRATEAHEEVADLKACVRALRKRIDDLLAPPREHG